MDAYLDTYLVLLKGQKLLNINQPASVQNNLSVSDVLQNHISCSLSHNFPYPEVDADMVKRSDKQAKFSCLVVTKLQCIDLTVIPT